MAKLHIVREFLLFLKQEKKYWLACCSCSDFSSCLRRAAQSPPSSIRCSRLRTITAVPLTVLGISAYYHDSAACLLVNGRIVATAQEERFTRKKHDERFPTHAVSYCLKEAGIRIEDVDYIGFYEKPLLKFDRLLESYIASAPRGLRSYLMAMPLWLGEKLWMADGIKEQLGV